MHIGDTLIDAASGGIVVPGQMQVDFPHPNMPKIASHRHLLLDFNEAGMGCRAVTVFDRLSSGLVRVSAVETTLRFAYLVRKVFDRMLLPSVELQDCGMRFEGRQSGSLVQFGYLSMGPYNQRIGIVSSLEVTQRIDVDGRTFRIVGALIPSAATPDPSIVPPGNQQFSIYGTIPWVTLRLLGFAGAGAYHKYRPRGSERPGIPAAPVPRAALTLEDLRSTGLSHVLSTALGSGMLLAGDIELRSPEKETTAPAREIVEIDLTDAEFIVRDADRARLNHDGFCNALKSYFSFTFTSLNDNLINGLLGADGTHAAATMSGAGLGRVNYDTGLGRGHGDHIRQDIEHFDFTMDLTNFGLDFSLAGTLRGFSDKELNQFGATFEESLKSYGVAYRRTFEQLMKPWVGFTIRATIPWLWLLIRRSPLATRMPIG